MAVPITSSACGQHRRCQFLILNVSRCARQKDNWGAGRDHPTLPSAYTSALSKLQHPTQSEDMQHPCICQGSEQSSLQSGAHKLMPPSLHCCSSFFACSSHSRSAFYVFIAGQPSGVCRAYRHVETLTMATSTWLPKVTQAPAVGLLIHSAHFQKNQPQVTVRFVRG
jgi:hypothetical protein